MNFRPKNKASVLLLVMGLLVIIALLGSSFVLVALMDRKSARSMNAALPMDAIAKEIVGQVVADRYQDLYLGARGPYTADANVSKSIDYPNEYVDRILATAEVEVIDGNVCWRHLSNMGVTPTYNTVPTSYTNIPVNTAGLVCTSGLYRDATNNPYNDSVLYATGNKDSFGREYYAAVRVIDASGLVNINTAFCSPALSLDPTAWNTTNINIASIFPNGIDANSVFRSLRNNVDQMVYNTNYVIRPWSPATNYDLINDTDLANILNGFCNPSADPNIGLLGPLVQAKTTDPNRFNVARPNMTTYSASRIFARGAKIPNTLLGGTPTNVTLTDQSFYATDINKADTTALFNAIYAAIPHTIPKFITSDANRREVAAQLAVNIAAFRSSSPDVVPTMTVPGQTKRVFGVTRQPYVTKVFYKRIAPDPNIPATFLSYSAIELYNPYDTAFNMAGLRIKCGTSNYTLPASVGTIDKFSRAVLVTATGTSAKGVVAVADDIVVNTTVGATGSGNSPTAALKIDITKLTVTPPEVNKIDFGADTDLRLFRPVSAGADSNVCIFAYASPATAVKPPALTKAAPSYVEYQCWDDQQPYQGNYFRYNSNKPFKSTVPGPDCTKVDPNAVANPILGVKNVSTYFTAGTVNGCPIYVRNGNFVNIAEISKILFVGPDETYDLRKKLDDLRNDPNSNAISDANWSLGRFDPATGGVGVFDPNFPCYTPRVPIGTSLCDYLMVNSPLQDGIPNDGVGAGDNLAGDQAVVFGKINVNTAPLAVLKSLPGIAALAASGIAADAIDANWLAKEIKDYRDDGGDANGLRRTQTAYPKNVRLDLDLSSKPTTTSDPYCMYGFAGIGEIAIPLQVRSNALAGTTVIGGKPYYNAPKNPNPQNRPPFTYSLTPTSPDLYEDGLPTIFSGTSQYGFDASKRNMYFAWLSNHVTVRSDVYIAFVRIQLGSSTTRPESLRRYIALIDRSKVKRIGDRPQILFFAQLRN